MHPPDKEEAAPSEKATSSSNHSHNNANCQPPQDETLADIAIGAAISFCKRVEHLVDEEYADCSFEERAELYFHFIDTGRCSFLKAQIAAIEALHHRGGKPC